MPEPIPVLKSMRFVKPVVVGGRPIESTDGDYSAEVLEFPWVRVYKTASPQISRLTQIFNVVDTEDFLRPKKTEAKTEAKK